jgi:hypothetical protein
MALTFESFRNLFSGYKAEPAQPTFTPASGRELEQVRDQLLGSALEIKQAWANDLLEGHAPAEEIDTYHQGRLDQINATFDGLRQLNPAITATLNSEEFRAAAYRQAQNERDEQARLESRAHTEAEEHSVSPSGRLSQAAFEQEEAEMDAREELLHNLEERYAPDPYDESGLSDSEIEFRDRIYEMDSRAAQNTALRELQELEQKNPALSYAELLHQYKAEVEPRREESAQEIGAPPLAENVPDSVAVLLGNQEENIRQEWQQDLQSGRQDQHDLETYFAGKIDQHNTMIELAVEANSKLQETLPPQINYEQIRQTIREQIQQQQQAPAQALEMAI